MSDAGADVVGVDWRVPLDVARTRVPGKAVQGNLGFRLKTFEPVWPIILQRVPATLMLMASALSIGILVGVPLGIFSALRKYSLPDLFLTGGVFLGISTPAFLIGLGALYVFSLGLRLFPAGGMHTLGQEESVLDTLHHLALPALILSANYIASMLRYTRASMLDVISEQYVTTARAKGLTERAVVLKHALSNGPIPVVTGTDFSGADVTGAIFDQVNLSRANVAQTDMTKVRKGGTGKIDAAPPARTTGGLLDIR